MQRSKMNLSQIKPILLIASLFLCFSLDAQQKGHGTASKKSWLESPFEQKVFVENNGQLDKDIRFSASTYGVDIYFSPKGVSYQHTKKAWPKEEDREVLEKMNNGKIEEQDREHYGYVTESMEMEWLGANSNVNIIPEQKVSFYYTYPQGIKKLGKTIVASAYSKITYKDLYPGIDVEYILPDGENGMKDGVKYSLIVHGGADVSKVKMKYKNAENISIDQQGNVIIKSAFGEFTDHAPKTFFKHNNTEIPNDDIASEFILNDRTISFRVQASSPTETVIVDPWTNTPNFPFYDASYDINWDNNGNVLVYGSLSPLKEAKFNSAGALQWIYNLTGASYAYGDFAVDEGSGRSYIGEGKAGPTIVHKVNIAGIEVGLSAGDPNMNEIWRMVFNRVTNKILLAGGSGTNFASVMDTDLTSVSVPFGNFNDIALLGIDNCPSSNNAYYGSCCNNLINGLPATTLLPTFFSVPDGYTFAETGSVTYVGGSNYAANGFNGVAVSPNFLYTYDGATLKKWNKTTGILISSLVINGTPFLQGGLDVDECDNVFVGHNNSISVYDVNLSPVTSFALPNVIYDLKLDKANLLYACGLGFTTSIPLPSPLNNVITLTQNPVTSCNTCNGSATVSISNLCSNTTYSWAPGGQTTTTATGLCVGTYTLTAMTGCNKILTDTITVTGNIAPLFLASTQVNILCNGNTTGTATSNPSGGVPPYTYLWSNAQTNQTATGLGAGTYTCTVTDANGCTATQTVTITQPPPISAPTSFVNTSCGNNNGSITVNATGGTGTLTYSWDPTASTNSTITGLSAGTYTVYITDANGCTQTATATIAPSTNPALSIQSQVDVLCNGASTGTATINVTGGNGPYTWGWAPSGGTNATASGLPAGTYTCTVTDASGCTATQIVTITQPGPIFLTANSTQTACSVNTGTATGSASGGNPGYTYSWWNNSQTTQTATGLGAGTYTVQVTDANGCTQLQTVIVTQNNPVTLTTSSTQSSCAVNDGTATANPANGTSPYTYSWSDGQTTQVATGLGAGSYTVTVTDANGCSQTQTVVVPQQAGPTANATASNTAISQGGSSQLNGTGGVSYSWYPSSGLSCTTCQNPVATPNMTTTYCVQVTDANGCTDVACVTINVDIPCILSTLETLLPNAFSPNGDMANDEYCVPANACVEQFLLKIYDRWGEKVFETDNLDKCWDGIYRGMLLNTDVFAYYFTALLSTGDHYSQKGNISLVR